MADLIEIDVFDGVSAKLIKLADLDFLNGALMAGAMSLKAKVAVYPPSRSVPGRYSLRTHRPMGWYKRGTGWMQPIVKKGVAVGYRNLFATSETFGKRWAIYSRSKTEVILGNNASYGPWAKSKVRIGDSGPQSRLLGAYGWTTVEDDVEKAKGEIIERVGREIEKQIGSNT